MPRKVLAFPLAPAARQLHAVYVLLPSDARGWQGGFARFL